MTRAELLQDQIERAEERVAELREWRDAHLSKTPTTVIEAINNYIGKWRTVIVDAETMLENSKIQF